MDEVLDTNPLGTVQFISVFTYLYAMSDFLCSEEYLSEIDQNKQIPVVNALYQYLEDHHDNQTMKLKLIKHLLQGSDLYGEQENENVDIVFVNTMFDYIIKSLVFNKYGNIYGFLADVVRNTKNLQLNSLLEEIFLNLKNATFDNEYGNKSSLTPLAANRIFTDIIRPSFPKEQGNKNILDIDYILAQAGKNFIKIGIINTVYYTDSKIVNSPNEELSFDEYLTTGLIVGNNLNKNQSLVTLQAFALPALFLYVTKTHIKNENISNIVSDPYYWKDVYDTFFSHIDNVFNQSKNQWINDTNYQLYARLLNFFKHLAKAKSAINLQCQHLNLKDPVKVTVPVLLSECNSEYLPYTIETFMKHIKDVSEVFQKHDLNSLQQSFGESLFNLKDFDKVGIHLLAPNDNIIHGFFDKSTRLPYDLFEFYYSENQTTEYYALMRDNLSTKLIKLADNSEDFQKAIGISVIVLLKNRFHRVPFKSTNETIDLFLLKFAAYKKLRLESYLTYSGTDSLLGEWWKEFGFNFVPFFQLKIEKGPEDPYDVSDNVFDELKYFSQLPKNLSQIIIQNKTRKMMSSSGMNTKTILLKAATDIAINATVAQHSEYVSQLETLDRRHVLEKLSLHIGEPSFGINSITKENINFLGMVISVLQEKNIFLNIKKYLSNILITKSYTLKLLEIIGTNPIKRIVFIKSTNSTNSTNTGYGYKFFYFNSSQSAQLRTIFEDSNKTFITLNHTKHNGEKVYSIVRNDTFQLEEGNIFKIDNQLRKDINEMKFTGIPMQIFIGEKDPICNYRNKEWLKALRHHDLFFNLICDVKLEVDNLTNSDGEIKIDALYSFRDRNKIEIGTSLDKIVTDYNMQLARFTVSFEDYYAIWNFATTGYMRIMESTHEALYMKLALYKLALRQFDDKSDKFQRTLYTIERIPNAVINKTLSVGTNYTFKKFSTAHQNELTAMKFADVPKSGYTNVFYEIKFTKHYFKVKIRKFYYLDDTISILLPGSKFSIESITQVQNFNMGYFLKITLLYNNLDRDKYQGYKNILQEITRINSKN